MLDEKKPPTLFEAEPLLGALVEAHRVAESITSFPELPAYACALTARCQELDRPLVWPVGDAAQRLAGAAVLSSEGEVQLRGWANPIAGERILLVAVAAVSPLELVQTAGHARAMGAAEVHACGVAVAGLDAPEVSSIFDSCDELEPALVMA